MSSLINKRAVRKLALDLANDMYSNVNLPDSAVSSDGTRWNYTRVKASRKGKKYNQVSLAFIDHINAMVRVNVQEYIKKNKPTGSTIK